MENDTGKSSGPAVIPEFQGAYRFLSNFWPADVHLDDRLYPSVEHAYQAAKTLDESERRSVRNAHSPGQAKRLGQRATKRADWNEVKLSVMENLVREKFTRHAVFREKLLATGDAEIVEGNSWGDRFWGVCKGVGENHLGKILMRVREELRNG